MSGKKRGLKGSSTQSKGVDDISGDETVFGSKLREALQSPPREKRKRWERTPLTPSSNHHNNGVNSPTQTWYTKDVGPDSTNSQPRHGAQNSSLKSKRNQRMNAQDQTTGKTYADDDMSQEAQTWRQTMAARAAADGAASKDAASQAGLWSRAAATVSKVWNNNRAKIGVLTGVGLTLGAEAAYRAYQDRKAEKSETSIGGGSSDVTM